MDPAVVQRVDHGQRFDVYASVPQDAAALLESLFDNESHAGELRPGLIDQFYRSPCGVAVGQEIVDEQYVRYRSLRWSSLC